jgi:chitinase
MAKKEFKHFEVYPKVTKKVNQFFQKKSKNFSLTMIPNYMRPKIEQYGSKTKG